jgi:hypothetical protein
MGRSNLAIKASQPKYNKSVDDNMSRQQLLTSLELN